MLGTLSKSLRKLQTQGLVLRICEPISYRKHLRICGKNSSLSQICKATTLLGSLLCNFQKSMFSWFNVSTDLVDVFIKYNTPLSSSAAVERLFSMGSNILTAKRASLMSRNLQRFVFLKGKMDVLKWQKVAQDKIDVMLCTYGE